MTNTLLAVVVILATFILLLGVILAVKYVWTRRAKLPKELTRPALIGLAIVGIIALITYIMVGSIQTENAEKPRVELMAQKVAPVQELLKPVYGTIDAPANTFGKVEVVRGGHCLRIDDVDATVLAVERGTEVERHLREGPKRENIQRFSLKSNTGEAMMEVGWTQYPPGYISGDTVLCPLLKK